MAVWGDIRWLEGRHKMVGGVTLDGGKGDIRWLKG